MPQSQIVRAASFGASRGRPFDDWTESQAASRNNAPISSIRSIAVQTGQIGSLTVVKGIQTTYLRNDRSAYMATRGALGSSAAVHPMAGDEHLIGIKGRRGDLLDQLTLLGRTSSALTSSGPHGGAGGSYFELNAHIIAFYGTSITTGGQTFLESLGVYIRAVWTGMAGGGGGTPFEDPIAIPGLSQIRTVRIRYGAFIDAISVTYDTPAGPVTHSHGGGGGYEDSFTLRAGERITGVFGRSGGVLDSIGFLTEDRLGVRRSYGPWGGGGGPNPFVIHAEVIGFAGRSGGLIDALGFYTLWP